MDQWLSSGFFGEDDLVMRRRSKGAIACACDAKATVRCVFIFATWVNAHEVYD